MQLDDPFGLVTLQPVAQELDEQVVIAEPLLVDPLQEQVAFLDLSSIDCPPATPDSADASSPQVRSVIEVASRKSSIDGSSVSSTFSARNSLMA